MESYGIDIKKIVRDLVQEELQRLGITNLPMQKNKVTFSSDPPEEEYIDDPMDVDLTWVENAKDLATVEGKIGDSAISVVVDSASNKDIMPKFVAEELGIEIDTSITRDIKGITGRDKTLGVASASVILAPECIIKTDFDVVDDYHIRELILSRPTLKYRYNYDLHESRNHMAVTCNGKDFFIPIVPDINRGTEAKKKIEASPIVLSLTT